MKGLKSKIIIGLIFMTILIINIKNVSSAFLDITADTRWHLGQDAFHYTTMSNSNFFNFDAKSLIGKVFYPSDEKDGKFLIHGYNATCIGHGYTPWEWNPGGVLEGDGNYLRIEKIIDIDINPNGMPGTVTFYRYNNDDPYNGATSEVKMANNIKFPILRYAYLAWAANTYNNQASFEDDLNGIYDVSIYKQAMMTIMYDFRGNISEIELPSKFQTNESSSGDRTAIPWSESYENGAKAYKFNVINGTGNIVNVKNHSYVGPFKIGTSQGYDISAQIDGYTIAGYATSVGGNISSINGIPNNTNFYIVVNGNISSNNINLRLNKKFNGYKARLMFLCKYAYSGGDTTQNYLVYRGEPTTITTQLNLTAEKKTGTLKIGKFDQDTGARLANVEFVLKDKAKNQFVIKNGTAVSYTTNQNSATVFKTNTYGEITITELPIGNYQIIETRNPNLGYGTNMQVKDVYVSGDITDSREKLKQATFNIVASSESINRNKSKSKQDYIKMLYLAILNRNADTGGLNTHVNILQTTTDATSIKKVIDSMVGSQEFGNLGITSQGKVEEYIKRLYTKVLGRNASVIEITSHRFIAWNGNSGIVITNKKQLLELTIKKTDVTTGDRLGNVSFSIKMTSGEKTGKYLGYNNSGNAVYYDTEHQMLTNVSKDIVIKNVYQGNYELKEIQNPNSGYETNVNKIVNTGTISMTENAKFTIKITNKRQYISISGLAWEDLAWNDGKGSKLNYLYKDIADDKNDRLLQGIDVYLCDYTKTDNKVVKYTKTGADGKYTFTNVNIDKLQDYYIIFRYNGMSYQNVSPSLDKTNGNKVAEGASRTSFNNQYATVEAGQANNVNGKKSYDLKYNRSKYKSEIAYGNTNGDKYPATGVDGQYYIMANTYETYGGYLNKIRTAEQIRQDGTTEMSHINLGLVKREQPDLSLDEDIHSARVQLNGETHVYEYSERMNNENLYGDAHAMEPQVKFEKSTYSGVSYERPMYASDIIAEGNDSLTVHVTYKVAIKNSSNNLNTVVNKITDYFDSKYYKAVSYGTEVNANGSIKNASAIQEKDVQTYNNEYSKATLNVNVKLEPQTTKFIYVEFQVNKQNIIDIVNKDEVVKLDNIVEISSYSIRDLQDAVYAGIDVDSQPGNLNIGDRTTFEDDTAEAPGLSLILQEERKTTGKVFLDSTDDKLLTAQVRQGSSAYEDGEKGISGVTVKLINKDGSIAKVYKKGETEKDAISTTDENGDYTISGFIPGEYYLEYTWGDKTYKVQDYKSTIVDEISYKAKGEGNNLEWYKDEFKKQYNGVEWDSINNKEIRRSDAVDNYATRENIDNQVKTITNASKAEMEKYEDGKIGEYDVIDKITSTTPTFKVNIEYNTINKLDNNTTKTNVNDEYEKNADGTLKIQNGYIVKKDEFKNTMKNIDFGIVERARQILDLNKNVQNVKITLANGSVLVNANVIDGKLENATENIVYLPETDVSPAQIKVEIDSEIIQGSTLELKYKLGVTNISEVEYATEKFYKYGKVDDANKIVTLTPDKIIDYLDNTMSSEIDTSKWRVLSDSEKKDIVTNGFIAKEVEKVLNSTNKVVTSDELAKTKLSPLEGNKSTTLSVTGYKILANGSEEETVLENNAEIIQVTKTGGAMLHTTPGNYIPGDMSTTEPDDAMSERFTIIPPTGNGVNYIAYAVLIISSLGILTAGIILIKKYVLKK